MLSIGELARRTRVSVRMLRHYDELGLVKPHRVDPATGYRWYSASQVGRGSGSSSDDAEDSSVISDDDPDVVADKKFREAQKAVKQAQKVLAEARKRERQTLREAKERVAKRR